jgi:Uma2 family endonuclease
MATVDTDSAAMGPPAVVCDIPELCAGDHLTRAEFERRYSAMPNVKKAELIEGVVYMPSPVSHRRHSRPHARLVGWLVAYLAATPGTDAGDNGTVRLDLENEPQPDAMLRILPECGGQSRDDDEYIGDAPELVAEIAASSESYDLHEKFRSYQRNGVREYIVWRVRNAAIDWFVLRDDRFEKLLPDNAGCLKSEIFPGLWLDPAAMIGGDLPRVFAFLQQGLSSAEHAAFVVRLEAAGRASS